MSHRASHWAWGIECSSSGEKLVLVALADHAGDDGACHPSTGRLSERTGLAKRTVQHYLDALEARGLLSRVRRRRRNGTLGVYDYRLTIVDDQSRQEASGSDEPVATDGHTQQAASGSGNGSRLDHTQQVAAQEPSVVLEPSIEPSGTNSPVPVEVCIAEIDTHEPETRSLCQLLADLIASDGSKRPRITDEWLVEADRLQRLDHRTPDQIEKAIRWCQADPFWRANVLSMPTLRKQYDRLRKAAQRDQPTIIAETPAQAVVARVARRGAHA